MFNKKVRHRLWILMWQVLVLFAILAAWQYLPESNWVRGQIRWMDPFFISSPTRVYHEIGDLAQGKNSVPSVWPYLWTTVKSTLIGTAIGLCIGTTLGALLSNSEFLRNVFTVYVVSFNSIPRIALIPIVVLITGPTAQAGVVVAILVVTFLAFFNALEGGRSVPMDTLQNAMLLGASKRQIMFKVRFPYVLMWTFAVVPNAVSFGLLTVVTTELLTGTRGMGGLILIATTNVNASLGFAVAVMLSIVGIILVTAASQLKKILLHWA